MNAKSSHKPARVVIEISGGNLQNVYSNAPLEILLVDYDNIEAGDPGPEQLAFGDGVSADEFMTGENHVF